MWNSEPPARFKRLPVLPAFMPCFGIGGGSGGGCLTEMGFNEGAGRLNRKSETVAGRKTKQTQNAHF